MATELRMTMNSWSSSQLLGKHICSTAQLLIRCLCVTSAFHYPISWLTLSQAQGLLSVAVFLFPISKRIPLGPVLSPDPNLFHKWLSLMRQRSRNRILKIKDRGQAVVHIFNLSTKEAKTDGSLSSMLFWSTEPVPWQLGLHEKTCLEKIFWEGGGNNTLSPISSQSVIIWAYSLLSSRLQQKIVLIKNNLQLAIFWIVNSSCHLWNNFTVFLSIEPF